MIARKKIFITGGHLTPAIAVIDELRQRGSWEIIFVGRSTSLEGTRIKSYEKEEMESRAVRFLPLTAGRFQRTVTWHWFLSLIKMPVGFGQALWYCMRERPCAVISFGGYIALPVVLSAAILGIPVLTHEQTLVPGLANRIIAFFAKKVCVTFEETLRVFPKKKAVLTGLPLRRTLLRTDVSSPFTISSSKLPMLYVTGGSTGSVSLNNLVFPLISNLLSRYTVIHQTGRVSLERAERLHSQLPQTLRSRYIVQDYFDTDPLSWILHHAHIVIGRSGANTVMELAGLAKIAILVPLPWAGGGEQMANARWFEANGGGVVVDQRHTTSEGLGRALQEIERKITFLTQKANILAKQIPRDGAHRLVAQLETLV